MKFTPDQQDRLDKLIFDTEQRSNIEMVVVAYPRLGIYQKSALWLSIIFLWIALLLFFFLPMPFGNYTILLGTLLAQMLGLGLALFSPKLQYLLSNKKEMARRCEITARALFQKARLYRTSEGTAMLIFVSSLERQALFIWDVGIETKIPMEQLREAQTRLSAIFQSAQPAEALLENINQFSLLAANFIPPTGHHINELPNRLDLKI